MLEAQAKSSAQAIFDRSVGMKLSKAKPRRSSSQEVEAASARINKPPADVRVGTTSHTMVVRTRRHVEIDAPAGLEVRSTQRPHPQRKDASVVSFGGFLHHS